MTKAGIASALAFLVVVAAVGCGSDDDSTPSGSGGSSASAGSAGSANAGDAGASSGGASTGGASSGGASGNGGGGASGSAGATVSCPPSPMAPGNSTHTINHGGVERQYVLHIPPGYTGQAPVPVVYNFHGYTSNMNQQAFFSGMDAKSDEEGFVIVYPNGLQNPGSGLQSWNAGLCCAFGDTDRDDVGFVDALLDDVAKRVCVDPKRVYATGMSNGAFMSHLLGCQRADRFAAIAPVAGVLGIPDASCTPSRPIPVIHFHGTQDTLVPYNGGGVNGYASVPDTHAAWAARNGCTLAPQQTFENGNATCETRAGCNGDVEVVLCTITGMGHCWPGQTVCPFGASTTDIHANDAMWQFFERFTLP